MGLRYYGPGTGRFLTRDPIGYAGGANLYSYAGNNPVNDNDPGGTSRFSDWYWGGMGGLGNFVSETFLFGTDKNLGNTVGEYDSGCASADVAWAGAKFAGAVALNVIPGGEEAEIEAHEAETEVNQATKCLTETGCFVAGTPMAVADGTSEPIERARPAGLQP